MHRIDVASATPESLFTDGSPAGGVPATTVTASWLNDLQENICKVVEAAGITLLKGNHDQLRESVIALALGTVPKRSFVQADSIRIPDVPGGLIIQWGRTGPLSNSVFTTVPLPIAFPSFKIGAVVTQPGTTIDTTSFKVRDDAALNSIGVLASSNSATGFYIAIGN